MKYSKLFTKALRSAPVNADTVNHKLLVQAGYIRQLMAGVYTYTPLGLRVLNKVKDIIRQEMDNIGGQEVLMPLLHPSTIWKQTGGWDSIDVLFKIKSRTGKDYALAQSNEETVTPLMKEWVHTYKDLPLSVYHINTKFRDELRSKSGILRGREFIMKDMYSMHRDQADFDRFYEECKQAYFKIFSRMGLSAKATEASGGAFSEKISYEFEVLTDAGEAHILHCPKCNWCINVDDITTYNEGESCPKCQDAKLEKAKAAEVGNVFDLGQKYTKAFDVKFIDEDGQNKYPIMGCYGIGISRTIGVLVEKFHDEKGIVWPQTVAPFSLHLVGLDLFDETINQAAEKLYQQLVEKNVDVLFDDRIDSTAGQKFADADLLGVPVRVVISKRSLQSGGFEYKLRDEKEAKIVNIDQLLSFFPSH